MPPSLRTVPSGLTRARYQRATDGHQRYPAKYSFRPFFFFAGCFRAPCSRLLLPWRISVRGYRNRPRNCAAVALPSREERGYFPKSFRRMVQLSYRCPGACIIVACAPGFIAAAVRATSFCPITRKHRYHTRNASLLCVIRAIPSHVCDLVLHEHLALGIVSFVHCHDFNAPLQHWKLRSPYECCHASAAKLPLLDTSRIPSGTTAVCAY